MPIGLHVLIILILIVIGGALINQIKSIPSIYRFLIFLILLNLILTVTSPVWSLLNIFTLDDMPNKASIDYWSIRGQIGDVLSGHFAALAFIALLITIYQMQKSLLKQDEAIKIQQEYIKKQEFENHFFKLYDEFKLEQENIHKIKIFEQYNKQISEENITEVKQYKKWIYSRGDYPKAYFNLLEFLLTYIYENRQIEQYSFFIKNKLSNLDLAYIALHDISTNYIKLSKILDRFNIYEHFNKDSDDIINDIPLLKDYSLLKNELKEYIQ